ncbi:hypothetical protein CBER1_07847 [Cercospora berteroae]|uniref:Uncharacterized protein n=1 Tax=Cercospora berteroae TaxID=357750 RepID=A0A2S6C543_9PEZI|nr:hypothetical protein CBER1_07847 [Cercospora berteroae]
MDIQQSAKRQPIIPTTREIPDFDLIIARRLSLTPQQQSFPRRQTLIIDITNRESQNQCPNQAKNNLPIPIHDIFSPNIRQLNLPTLDKVERDIDIFKALHTKFGTSGVAAEGFGGEDFEEMDEDDAVAEVADEIIEVEIADLEFIVEPV